MLQEQLPCKAGAKFALHYMEAKLLPHQSLQEQGIVREATLSCTRLPTNLMEAYWSVRNLRDESELEGVRSLKGARDGDYLCYLPRTLENLSFSDEFNRSLEHVTFPGNLESLMFGKHFDRDLKQVKFPNNLQSLAFGGRFNCSLEHVNLPDGLRHLTFGRDFDQHLEQVKFPSNLQSLTFGKEFNQNLERVTLPSHLQSLTFHG